MPEPNKNRFYRMLPGRIRVEIYGLLGNSETAERLAESFAAVEGVREIDPCVVSGRALILFDEKKTAIKDIWAAIREAEAQADQPSPGSTQLCPAACIHSAKAEVAAANQGMQYAAAGRIPLPLALSMGGLAALGLKRLVAGKSSLAGSPLPFYLSGLVSVITGYPFLKRGVQKFAETRKWNADLILGTGALALALVRENLVVLAGLGILQYVNWKKAQTPAVSGQSPPMPRDVVQYAEKAGKWGAIAAAATWAVTRNPLRGIAVLLAANPRPATIPAELAWKHAESVSKQRNYVVPDQGSLSGLARTRTILVEDTSLLIENDGRDEQGVVCKTNEDDADKVLCLAAALMKNSGHPWKEEIWNEAGKSCRTIRTAFQVQESELGIRGKVGGLPVLVGSQDFMRLHQVETGSFGMIAKRWQRKGHSILFVANQTRANGLHCVGLLIRKAGERPLMIAELLARYAEKGWRIGVLHNSSEIPDAVFGGHHADMDWLSLEPGEILEKIAVLHQKGEEVLFVSATESNPLGLYLKEAGIPSLSAEQLQNLSDTAEFAGSIDRTVNRQLALTKSWNLIGGALAFAGAISAPAANLCADALSLVFLSRAKRAGDFPVSSFAHPAAGEIAAAGEAAAWHAFSAEEVKKRFQTDEHSGLSPGQVRDYMDRFGPNRLENKKPVSWLSSFLGQFKEFTTLILLGTVTVALCTGGRFDGIAMGAILLANAAIATFQERKADKVLEALNRFQPPGCRIVRDGRWMDITGEELVPGDIVRLEAGDRVPADIRLLRSRNLRANEAALTGESLPVDKQEAVVDADCALSDRRNMLYMGTDICGGNGIGIVVQTGMDTEMGQLVHLLKTDEKETTPLQQKVTGISKKFVKGALVAGAALFVTGLLRGIPISQIISTSITLAASAIPEGLPVTITIALSAGIFRMAKKKTLIRKLSALETLGRTTIICTDKTGTLTKNEMTVRTVATVNRAWNVSGNGYDPTGTLEEVSPEVASAVAGAAEKQQPSNLAENPDLKRLLEIGVLCNNSKLEQLGGVWSVKGDPTEGALLALSAKNGLWADRMAHWCRGLEIPFDSNSGKMSVVCHMQSDNRKRCVFSKGAVEVILRHCSYYQADGEVKPLSEENKRSILLQNEMFSQDAMRVLAFAYRPVEPQEQDDGIDERDMIYVGLAGMIDPPKPEVEASIRDAFALGVKPVMITGDHPITAIAIARQLGIYDGTQQIISGHQLNRLSDEELAEVVEDVAIFARVTPEHKLRIVKAFQQCGQIVAMTGDGVNDTPAIKQADVGIAMGKTGSDVTKETADMVLEEDDFGSIVEAVKEGRTIMGNIRKALGCLLTGNLAEIIVTSAAVMAGLPIPLIPIQILLMNLLTDALPAMILAVNPGNKSKQTNRTDIVDKDLYRKVVVKGVLLGAGSLGLFAASLAAGAPLPVAQSVAFATLVAGQLIQTFSWRQEGSEEKMRDWTKDRFLIGAFGMSWLALLAALYIPPVAGFFHTAPLSWQHWIPIFAVAGSISLLSKPLLALFTHRSGQAAHRGMIPAAAY